MLCSTFGMYRILRTKHAREKFGIGSGSDGSGWMGAKEVLPRSTVLYYNAHSDKCHDSNRVWKDPNSFSN